MHRAKLLVDLQLFLPKLFNLLESGQVVFEQHFGVSDGILGSDKDEWHTTLFSWDGRFGLIVALDLDSHHAGLVDNLLDESAVFANDFAYKTSRNLKRRTKKLTFTITDDGPPLAGDKYLI